MATFDEAEQKAFVKIIHYLSLLDPESAEASKVADALYDILVREYKTELSSGDFKRLVTAETSTIYKALVRADKTLARVDFGLPDARAMKYLDESALHFLGKYAASPELERKVKDYIRKSYLAEGKAIGDNPKVLNAFMDTFKDQLNASKDQVRNIIDTTVSRARVAGQVNGLRAGAAKTYVIAGPDDSKTCPFCHDMIGRTFTVASAVSRLDAMTAAGAADVNSIAPFLKGSMPLSEVQDSTDEELEAAGFAMPPYHGSCRHRLVVDTFYEGDEQPPYDME